MTYDVFLKWNCFSLNPLLTLDARCNTPIKLTLKVKNEYQKIQFSEIFCLCLMIKFYLKGLETWLTPHFNENLISYNLKVIKEEPTSNRVFLKDISCSIIVPAHASMNAIGIFMWNGYNPNGHAYAISRLGEMICFYILKTVDQTN